MDKLQYMWKASHIFFCFRQHRTLVTIVVILFMVQLFVFAVFYAAWNPPPARREPAEPKEPTTLKTQKSEPLEAPKAAPLSAGMLSKLWKKTLETYIDLKRNMIVCWLAFQTKLVIKCTWRKLPAPSQAKKPSVHLIGKSLKIALKILLDCPKVL